MFDNRFNRLAAQISRELEGYWEEEINWEQMANKFDFVDVIGEYEGEEFVYYSPIDSLVEYGMGEDIIRFLKMMEYVYIRYGISLQHDTADEIEEFLYNEDNNYNEILFPENHDKLKMFISYSTYDKKIAEEIQDFFEKRGIYCFLSANKLETSDIWKERIVDEIRNANVFVFILSSNFRNSNWCTQEAGMAILKNKINKALICPVPIEEIESYGFIKDYHGPLFEGEETLNNIINRIRKVFPSYTILEINNDEPENEEIKEIDNLIASLANITSYASSNTLFSKLRLFANEINSDQVNKIIEYTLSNDQVLYSFGSKNFLSPLIIKYADKLDTNNVKEINEHWDYYYNSK